MITHEFPKPEVTLLGCTKDPLEVLYSACQIYYSQDDAVETWQMIQNSAISREKMVMDIKSKLGTISIFPIKQVQFVFLVNNISKVYMTLFDLHQMRTKGEDISKAYFDQNIGVKSFATPPSFQNNQHVLDRWLKLQDEIIHFYKYCSENGIKQEDIGLALPMGTISRQQLSIGFQTMQQFLDIRMCETTHWELKELGWQMYHIIKKEFPTLGERLGIKCWDNRNLYCNEDIEIYKSCKWNKTRPHKNEMIDLWQKKEA